MTAVTAVREIRGRGIVQGVASGPALVSQKSTAILEKFTTEAQRHREEEKSKFLRIKKFCPISVSLCLCGSLSYFIPPYSPKGPEMTGARRILT